MNRHFFAKPSCICDRIQESHWRNLLSYEKASLLYVSACSVRLYVMLFLHHVVPESDVSPSISKAVNFPFFCRTRLRFEFRASNPNGILLYTAESDFIECHLEAGRVCCSFSAGGDVLVLKSPQDSYSDGEWHSVSCTTSVVLGI